MIGRVVFWVLAASALIVGVVSYVLGRFGLWAVSYMDRHTLCVETIDPVDGVLHNFPVGITCTWEDSSGTMVTEWVVLSWETTALLWGGPILYCVGYAAMLAYLVVFLVRRSWRPRRMASS